MDVASRGTAVFVDVSTLVILGWGFLDHLLGCKRTGKGL